LKTRFKTAALASIFMVAAAFPAAAQDVNAAPQESKSTQQEAEELSEQAKGLREFLEQPAQPRPPTPEEEAQYQELKKALSDNLALVMKPLNELNERYKQGEIDDRGYEAGLEKIKEERRKIWRTLMNKALGAPYMDLPEAFSKAVHSCTADNKPVSLSVKMSVNINDIDALLGVSSEVRNREDWGGYQQVVVGDNFLGTIDAALRAKIKLALEDINEDYLSSQKRAELDSAKTILGIQDKFENVTAQIHKNYNLRVIIKPEPIQDSTARKCDIPVPPLKPPAPKPA
jgi:hypothetical protein